MLDQTSTYDKIQQAGESIRQRSPLQIRIVIVLGSGLGSVADEVDDAVSIPYSSILHFPVSTVTGHAGRLILGTFAGEAVAIMAGRAHLYEGYTAEQVALPIQVMHALGADTLLITNAAGGVNPGFHAGTLMLITDHINLTGQNPLIGPLDDRLGPRFPDMSEAYHRDLQQVAWRASQACGVPLASGVYMGLQGPSFETPAEIRMARTLGADAVGMSTVLEVIAANHAGMRVLGISCITNMAAGMLPVKLSHLDVVETADRVGHQFAALIRAIVSDYRVSTNGT
jgi:purine-nucleoside phosphorylase